MQVHSVNLQKYNKIKYKNLYNNQHKTIQDRQKEKKRELILGKHDIIMVLSKNVKTRSQSKLADWLFLLPFLKFNQVRRIFMLYEIKFDNTKNIKLNEGTFNCSIKIAILNKTFEAGLIKEERYQELKQNILQEYNLSHIGI